MPAKAKSKKDTDKEEILVASEAVMAALDQYKDLRCVSLEKGGRVENTLSTDSLILDLILGGGLQRGRIADFYGPESSGKTTILQGIIKSAQRACIPSVIYDFEHAMDPTYMRAQGLNLEFTVNHGKKKLPGFFYTQPGPGEDAYKHMKKTLELMPRINPEKPGLPTLVFAIDSFAAMFSEAEDPESTGKGGLGLDARMHSIWLRQLRNLLRTRGALLILSNQLRANIDLKNPRAPTEKEPGGNALKFYADYKVRMSARRRDEIDSSGLATQRVFLRTIKNKCFPPFQEAQNELLMGRGIDKMEDAIQFLKAIGRLELRGAYRRIRLKAFDTGKGMSPAKFREVVESPEFREFAFKMLRNERVYAAYFKQNKYLNYIYDAQRNAEKAA